MPNKEKSFWVRVIEEVVIKGVGIAIFIIASFVLVNLFGLVLTGANIGVLNFAKPTETLPSIVAPPTFPGTIPPLNAFTPPPADPNQSIPTYPPMIPPTVPAKGQNIVNCPLIDNSVVLSLPGQNIREDDTKDAHWLKLGVDSYDIGYGYGFDMVIEVQDASLSEVITSLGKWYRVNHKFPHEGKSKEQKDFALCKDNFNIHVAIVSVKSRLP